MGHWEALAADSRLGLESKLEAAAIEKRGKTYQPPEELKELPKGALFILLPQAALGGSAGLACPSTACTQHA